MFLEALPEHGRNGKDKRPTGERLAEKNNEGPEQISISHKISTGKSELEIPAKPGQLNKVSVTIEIFAGTFLGTIKVKDTFHEETITAKRIEQETLQGKRYTYLATFNYAISHDDKNTVKDRGILYTVTPGGKTHLVKMVLAQETLCIIGGPNPLEVEKGESVGFNLIVQGLGTSGTYQLKLPDGTTPSKFFTAKEEGQTIIKAGAAFETGGELSAVCTGTGGKQKASNTITVNVKPKAVNPTGQFISAKVDCSGEKADFTADFNNPDNYELIFKALIVDLATGRKRVSQTTTTAAKGPMTLSAFFPPVPDNVQVNRRRFKAKFVIVYVNEGERTRILRKSGKLTFSAKQEACAKSSNRACSFFSTCEYDQGIGEEDEDEDGIKNLLDNCPAIKNSDQADGDNDGVGNLCDNCPTVPNTDQLDADDDQLGDACDLCPDSADGVESDADGDGYGDSCDKCPNVFNPEQSDIDEDGIGDMCGNCPDVLNPEQTDTDGNDFGDACQEDLCIAPECCQEFPNACADLCYAECKEGYIWDEENCPVCVEAADIEPPLVSILAPASGASVPLGLTVQVTVLFSDSGKNASGIVSGVFSASGESLDSGPNPASFTMSPTGETSKQFNLGIKSDLTGVDDRTIVVTAQGTDADGNQSAVDTISLIVGGEGQALLLSVSPQDPGPNVNVTVTVTVTNCLPVSTQIKYSVVGTDGYSQTNTLGVDGQCQTSFTIPGGASGVSDVVNVEIVGSDISQTVTYVF